jgi:flotillin
MPKKSCKKKSTNGNADALLLNYQAEAEGVKKVLEAKALGYSELLKSVNSDARALATLLMVEKIESIVEKQVEAIKNLKIDKITVWDSGEAGNSSTSNFVSSFVKSLPPLQDIAGMAGVELPSYLGKMTDDNAPRKVAPQQVPPAQPNPHKPTKPSAAK